MSKSNWTWPIDLFIHYLTNGLFYALLDQLTPILMHLTNWQLTNWLLTNRHFTNRRSVESRWVTLGHLRVGVIQKKWVTGVWPLPLVFHGFIEPEYLTVSWKPRLFFQFFRPASCSRCSTASTSPSRSTTAASGSSSVTRSPTASTTKVRPLDFCHVRCNKCYLQV